MSKWPIQDAEHSQSMASEVPPLCTAGGPEGKRGMFAAAASAVSSLVTVRQPGASLLPHIDDLRALSMRVAGAVAEAAAAEGSARVKPTDIRKQVQDAMGLPEYRQTVAIGA